MPKVVYPHSSTSVLLRVKILDSSSTTGAGLTGLTFSSAGLIISTIADVEATPTVYAQSASNIEDITTLGTFAAPTASKCRFKEVDSTNHPGVYEIQIADARWSVSNAELMVITVSGATNVAELDMEIQLGIDANTTAVSGSTAVADAIEAVFDGTGEETLTLEHIVINNSSGAGLDITGSTNGMNVTGSGGHGILALGDGGGGSGMILQGDTTGDGLTATGGSSGHGVNASGGVTSGDGINASGQTLGHGMNLTGAGASRFGLNGVLATDILTADALNSDAVDEIADGVWDEVLTGATHNVPSSSGRRLRTLQDFGVYEGGAVWIDTVNGTAGTVDFENATVTNPALTLADAITIAASVGLVRFRFLSGSDVALAAAMDGKILTGTRWTLALGAQSISNATIIGADVSGIGTGAVEPNLRDCHIGNVTLPPSHFDGCGLEGTFTIGTAGTFFFDNCHSGIAGTTTPILDFGSALNSSDVSFRAYSGGIETQNMGAGTGSYNMSLEGDGQLIINANCSATSTVAIRGHFTVTDNAGGAVTLSDDARYDIGQISTAVGTRLNTAIPGSPTADSTYQRIVAVDNYVPYIPASIWIDTVFGSAGSTFGTNGTRGNAVLALADAVTLAAASGIREYGLLGASSILLISAHANWSFHGQNGAIVNLGGVNTNGSHFECLTVTGDADGNDTTMRLCKLQSLTNFIADCTWCLLIDNVTEDAGEHYWFQCASGVAGTGVPYIDADGDAINARNNHLRGWFGGLEIRTHTSAEMTSFDCSAGQIVVAASSTGGTMALRGNIAITDNASGAVTFSQDAAVNMPKINAEADTALSDYDGPTNAEMEARTLPKAEYGSAVLGTTIWYVDGGGDDSDGLTWGTAFNTLAQAISAATSGDLISIGPGTLTESNDASAKELTFDGSGPSTVLTDSGAGSTLQIGNKSIVRNMTVSRTGAFASADCITVTTKEDVLIEDVRINSMDVGIDAINVKGLVVRRSMVSAVEHAIRVPYTVADPDNFVLIEKCRLSLTGFTLSQAMAIQVTGDADLRVRDTQIYVDGAQTLVTRASLGIQYAGGLKCLIDGCSIYAKDTDAGTAVGIHIATSGVDLGSATIRNTHIETTANGGTSFDIRVAGAGTIAYVDGNSVHYERTKVAEVTSGRLIDIARGTNPELLESTTIATLASQVSFTVTHGPAENNAWKDSIAVIRAAGQVAFGVVNAYTGATKTVTLRADPGIFTMAVGDRIDIGRPGGLAQDTIRTGTFDVSEDVYHADVSVAIDEANTQDRWLVTWYKNGVVITSGITSPNITVLDDSNNLLLNGVTMTEVGTTEAFKLVEGTNRITAGEEYVVTVSGTIDGSARTWRVTIRRDSSA